MYPSWSVQMAEGEAEIEKGHSLLMLMKFIYLLCPSESLRLLGPMCFIFMGGTWEQVLWTLSASFPVVILAGQPLF